jgi:NADPH:quinone reductase-like Zn-dependent oxidoreductase
VAGAFLSLFNGKSVKMVTVESKSQDLDLISSWIQDGGLKVAIDSVYDVRDLGVALKRHGERSNKAGRVVLKVDGGWHNGTSE